MCQYHYSCKIIRTKLYFNLFSKINQVYSHICRAFFHPTILPICESISAVPLSELSLLLELSLFLELSLLDLSQPKLANNSQVLSSGNSLFSSNFISNDFSWNSANSRKHFRDFSFGSYSFSFSLGSRISSRIQSFKAPLSSIHRHK